MSGIHQKQQQQHLHVETESNGGPGKTTTAAIPIDTLWNVGFNIVLVTSIILVGWLCYRAFKRYVIYRISEWNGFDRHIEQKENDDGGGGGDSDFEEERSRSPRRQTKDSVRFRK